MTFSRRAGEKLDHYTLEEPLGRGGFSEVWRASAAGGGEVALKIVVHDEHAAQLRAEASALTFVRGPGIVPVLDVRLDHDPPFIALQLLRGGDLRARVLARGALPAVEAVAIFEKVVSVLARVHREGVVHGDLKPENVLFDEAGGVHLADFGLSRRISQRSASLSLSASLQDARLAGTLDYMAPEQRAGERPTPRSDVFALGVLFYELLVGERPQGVFAMPSTRDPSLPPVIDRALASSLAPDPSHRFASAGALLGSLREGLGSDWQALAQAHRRVTLLLDRKPAMRVATSSIVSFGVSGLAISFAASGGDSMRPTEQTITGLFGFLGALVGLSAVYVLWWAFEPRIERRRERLRELKRTIELQVRAETQWTAVREARRAAAIAPPGRSIAYLGALALCGVLLVFSLVAGSELCSFWFAVSLAGLLLGPYALGRDTRPRRGVPSLGQRRR